VVAVDSVAAATEEPRAFWQQEVRAMLTEFAGHPLEAGIRKLARQMGIDLNEGREP